VCALGEDGEHKAASHKAYRGRKRGETELLGGTDHVRVFYVARGIPAGEGGAAGKPATPDYKLLAGVLCCARRCDQGNSGESEVDPDQQAKSPIGR